MVIRHTPSISEGTILSNSDIVSEFKCGNMGGMRYSRKSNTLVLVSDPFKGFYEDCWHGDVLHYTGMGKEGDQTLDGNQNRRLFESDTNGVDVYLFEVNIPKEYTYIGAVGLADACPFYKQDRGVFHICSHEHESRGNTHVAMMEASNSR